jgi:hypothetical protein
MLEVVTLLVSAVLDIFRPRWSLLAQNAALRHQLAIALRSVPRPRMTRLDRLGLVIVAQLTPAWRKLRVVQHETLLR